MGMMHIPHPVEFNAMAAVDTLNMRSNSVVCHSPPFFRQSPFVEIF
jgi:hypothetical protein